MHTVKMQRAACSLIRVTLAEPAALPQASASALDASGACTAQKRDKMCVTQKTLTQAYCSESTGQDVMLGEHNTGRAKVPACVFSPGQEASDDGYLRGPPVGSG